MALVCALVLILRGSISVGYVHKALVATCRSGGIAIDDEVEVVEAGESGRAKGLAPAFVASPNIVWRDRKYVHEKRHHSASRSYDGFIANLSGNGGPVDASSRQTRAQIGEQAVTTVRDTAASNGGKTMDQTNLDIYGAESIPWSRALEQLEAGAATSYWLATTRPDGRPHSAAVGALWVDGKVYFTSGAGTRKSRNLAKNPNCAVSVSLPGLDLVIEGTATRVTDEGTLERLANLYAAGGWPATVSEGAITAPYSAPSAGPAPWDLYAVTPMVAFCVATTEPYGATRWRFG